MANPPRDAIADDFLEQIMAYGDAQVSCGGGGEGESGFLGEVFPLGPTSEQNGGGCGKVAEEDGRDRSASASAKIWRKEVGVYMTEAILSQIVSKELTSVFPLIGHVQNQHVHANPSPQGLQPFHGQPTPVTTIAPQQTPAPRPRVRARRGQATDPHSIAERLRRERIAERIRAIQDLVPTVNKTDRAAMLDEIVDYVKFLKLQVKVLSMSRLGGAGAVDPLVTDVPLPSIQGHATEGASSQQIWDKWSTDDVEQQVAKLMEEDIGAAMQFLRSKALCIMPISFAATIFHGSQQPEAPLPVKPEPNSPL